MSNRASDGDAAHLTCAKQTVWYGAICMVHVRASSRKLRPHAAAVAHELAAINAFVEDFHVAKRAQTLRSKQVRQHVRILGVCV